ncbi:hypothetical protein JY651_30085 [Pyxidicoccus parkwayensis]|uniref:Uncharacterized protein n=1 Tax=Pyxidicoccus parkwayensis TaxID=2813578 RepID=A0ABX7NM89_9BACT|nr:hypothetical protein JY651_30085 [Pyxidicoccus parkwaysis]
MSRSGFTGPGVIDAQTVTSVGPYALSSVRPAPQRRATSGGSASPAEMTVASLSSPSVSNCASTEGVNVTALMRCSRSRVRRGASGSSRSRGACTSVAPASSVANTSHTQASKPGDAYWSTRSLARKPWARTAASAVFVRPPWCSSVPFGVPVVPDV